MNRDARLRQQIESDLQMSTRNKVVYLEGESDVDIFCALLGRERPVDSLIEGIHIKGLSTRGQAGSGRQKVEELVQVGQEHGYGVFGFTDGDGRGLAELAAGFDAPHPGPLFCWKGYCIENVLMGAGWPWHESVDVAAAMRDYGPYVALNRLHRRIQLGLREARLHRYMNPESGRPLFQADEMAGRIQGWQRGIEDMQPAQVFAEELAAYHEVLVADMDAAHAWVNGKWFVRHLGPTHTKRSSSECLEAWLEHVIAVGGLEEVRTLFAERIAAS